MSPMLRRLTILALSVSVTLFGLSLALFVTAGDPAPWNPLGDYPIQVVGPLVPRVGGVATITVNDRVPIIGTKCNNADHKVDVRGMYEWKRVDPLGVAVPGAASGGVRLPGCTTFSFLNPIPDAIVADVLARGPSIWQITGIETPLDKDGGEGVPRTYQSENFRITP